MKLLLIILLQCFEPEDRILLETIKIFGRNCDVEGLFTSSVTNDNNDNKLQKYYVWNDLTIFSFVSGE